MQSSSSSSCYYETQEYVSGSLSERNLLLLVVFWLQLVEYSGRHISLCLLLFPFNVAALVGVVVLWV